MTREEFDATADALATRARKGDADAFDDLCRLLRDDVWRYCYALLRDREQAFDASQDTFLRCVRAIPKWRGDAPVRVFVLVLARRAVADLIRSEQRRRRIADVAVEPVVAVPQQTGTIEVTELINQLAEDQRQAFVLTQVLGLPYEDAADVEGVAVGTIRSRVFRARERLADAIAAAEAEADRTTTDDSQERT
jgi:RNA polymerase sigma-70 factor (ECF subfamily)